MRLHPKTERGTELAYAQAVVAAGSKSNTTYADVPGLSISFVARNRPVMLELEHPFLQVGNAGAYADLAITTDTNTVLAAAPYYAAAAAAWGAVSTSVRLGTLTPGTTYTYKVRSKVSAGAYGLGSVSFAFPTFLRAVEL